MNYFVEGLQGSGKSTLIKNLSMKYPAYTVFREGDYSPVELAWCTFMTKDRYAEILEKYRDIRSTIEEKSHVEGDHVIVCYTQIKTDIPGFYKDLEQYEIYNGRLAFDEFKRTIFERYNNWNGDDTIFECSLFQNIVEDMILYRNASDQEIMDFYKELADIVKDKPFRIFYLKTENIAENINVIRKERCDENGNEMWFPLMLKFFDESPFARSRGIYGEEELYKHFSHRQELELYICRELFPDKLTVLKSKEYSDQEL
ncbi:MAG: deoxynucleoside kinase [Erysipelotrichaceae bacterium]|nr:deoxynucleoside kinase [Erysipelotrichaceae bacterium]